MHCITQTKRCAARLNLKWMRIKRPIRLVGFRASPVCLMKSTAIMTGLCAAHLRIACLPARCMGRLPKMLWQHSLQDIIGIWHNLHEDDRGLIC